MHALARVFGCARVVFNDALRARQEACAAGLPYISDAVMSARLTAAKARPERAWLTEVSSVALQQALADLNAAYRNFFASVRGKRKGPQVGPPRFRSRKDNRQSVRFTANARFKVLPNGRLRLPKVGDVEIRWSRSLPSAPSSVTVIKDAAGRYFASFVVETDPAADAQRFPVAGGQVRAGVRPDRPVRADLPVVLSLRRERRAEATQGPPVDVHRMRCRSRPGPKRREERTRPGTQGEAKRLRRRRQTRVRPCGCRRNRNPPRCRVSDTAGIPPVRAGRTSTNR